MNKERIAELRIEALNAKYAGKEFTIPASEAMEILNLAMNQLEPRVTPEMWKELGRIEAERTTAPVTIPDTSQDWAKLDGAVAWHLIERHADNWAEVGNMMESWLAARMGAAPVSLTDEQIVEVLHSLGVDTGPSKYGFEALQVSATSVPTIRKIVEKCAALLAAAPRPAVAVPLENDPNLISILIDASEEGNTYGKAEYMGWCKRAADALIAATATPSPSLAVRDVVAAAPAPIQQEPVGYVSQSATSLLMEYRGEGLKTSMRIYSHPEPDREITVPLYAEALAGSQVQAAGDAGKVQAIKSAVSAIYFDDSSDYKTALWEVVQALDSAMAKLLEENPSAAYSQADAAAMREQP